MTERAKKLLLLYYKQSRKIRRVSGLPPLTFKAKKAGTLKNYRIYGQTVDGESVGDRTGNLFDGNFMHKHVSGELVVDDNNYGRSIVLDISSFNNGDKITFSRKNVAGSRLSLYQISSFEAGGKLYTDSVIFPTVDSLSVTLTIADKSNYPYLMIYLNDDNTTITDEELLSSNIMLNTGSTPLPYEPYGYKVPVTVSNGTDTQTIPIYLPEQIRKVGDEAEYIEYGSQKQYRVRKNLLPNIKTSTTINGVTFTVNEDGSITCNGTASALVIVYPASNNYTLPKGAYKLTGCPINGTGNTFCQDVYSSSINLTRDYGDGAEFNVTTNDIISVQLIIFAGYTCDNLTFYPMIRKADITDDTYEPYIENTDLDVALPALPTVTGTNVMSVGTEVQPSYVEINGRIKAAGGD